MSDRVLREKLEKEHMEKKMALQQQRVRQYPARGNTNCGTASTLHTVLAPVQALPLCTD